MAPKCSHSIIHFFHKCSFYLYSSHCSPCWSIGKSHHHQIITKDWFDKYLTCFRNFITDWHFQVITSLFERLFTLQHYVFLKPWLHKNCKTNSNFLDQKILYLKLRAKGLNLDGALCANKFDFETNPQRDYFRPLGRGECRFCAHGAERHTKVAEHQSAEEVTQ